MKELITEKKAEHKRAFIYCRTSEDSEQEDDKKVSIETQEASGKELAINHGYQVIDVFKDRNRSGRLYPTGFAIQDVEVENYCNECRYSASNRTRNSLGELLQRIREVDVIIVRKADRLMRPLPLSKLDAHVLTILKSHNVIVHSHDDNIIDPHNPDHVFLFKVTSTIQSKYVADRRDETKIGLAEKRDKGQLYFCPNFYGFKSIGVQQIKRNEEELKIVKRIFNEFLEGKTLKAIARDLNSPPNPVPTYTNIGFKKDGTGYWLDSTIRSILKRPQYAGFQYKSNGSDEIPVPAFDPPAITREIFKKVETKLEGRKTKRVGNTKAIHGLTGLVRCGYCGYKLYTTATYIRCKKVKYKLESFRCNTPGKTKAKTPCQGVQVRERFAKGLVRKNGKTYSNGLEDCLFPLIYKGYINYLIAKNRRVGLDDEIEQLLAILEQSKNHKKNLGQKLMDKVYTDKTFDMLMKQAEEASSKVERRLELLQKEAHDISRIEVPTELYVDYASHELAPELKQRLFNSIIDHIDVWHEFLMVYLKGGGKYRLPRIRLGKTYVLPTWRIVEVNSDSHELIDTNNVVPHVKSKHTPLREDTMINVVYEYDNDDPMQVIYGDENFIVMTEGKNRKPIEEPVQVGEQGG